MPSALALLSGAHLLMLSAFVGATSVAMLVAVLGRLRIPRTLCVWRRGRFTALPLGPLLFLLATAAAFIGASWEGHALPPHVLIGYPAGGVFWTIATWLVRSVVITEYGLVTDIYRLHQAVAWGQIEDYFVADRNGGVCYTFFYRDAGERRRLDLPVPTRHAATVANIVASKLDARFTFTTEAALGEMSSDQWGAGP